MQGWQGGDAVHQPGFNLRVRKLSVLIPTVRDEQLHRLVPQIQVEHAAKRAILWHCFGSIHRSPRACAAVAS
eukprot:11609720-Alexandrium_andersonii.AAC.1